MPYKVSPKGQVVIVREVREKLGVKPGLIAVSRVVGDRAEVCFFPPPAAGRSRAPRPADEDRGAARAMGRGAGDGGEGMSAILDTRVVVRYLTGDPPELAERAARVLDREEVALTPLVLAEAAYVLTKVYGVPRAAAVDALIELLQKENVDLMDLSKEAAIAALLFARPSGRVSFTDALIWTEAREKRLPVYTFDRRFPAGEVEVRVL